MLETNLRELQAEYKRNKEAEEQQQQQQQRHMQYESFNIAGSDSWESLPAAVAGSDRPSAVQEAAAAGTGASNQLVAVPPQRSSFLASPRALFSSINPFGSVDSEEEYDASGKNPFAE